MSDGLLVVIVAVALAFDFTNGFHDTANAVATSVSTRALTPRIAVLVAAVMNFLGAFTSTKVAKTVGGGLINTDQSFLTGHLILAALIGAIAWNLFTWALGLPSSSSHALVGGLVGAALASGGSHPVDWGGIWSKVAWPGLASPVIGFAIAGALMIVILWVFRRVRPTPLNRGFRLLQILSGSFMAFAHGTNDAQKTMGVIALALFASGHTSDPTDIPTWVIVAAAAAIAAGTYVGGWRIMRTMGTRIFKLEPPQGFAAQATASGVLYTVATKYGFPVSTTHVISSSVMGAGATTRVSAVRWGVAADIVMAWIFTIPAAGLVAAGMYEVLSTVM
ncbi:MAG TPA: anion permease [Gaiellales bacterium]|jgi:PiT family inorganic phosphate transporter|nr:anion permease [Gaiellales bacterium]